MVEADTSRRHLFAVARLGRLTLATAALVTIVVLLLLMLAAGRAMERTSDRLQGAAFCECPAARPTPG